MWSNGRSLPTPDLRPNTPKIMYKILKIFSFITFLSKMSYSNKYCSTFLEFIEHFACFDIIHILSN